MICRFHGDLGHGLRQVVVQEDVWLVLISWTPTQQFQRWHVITDNARFAITHPTLCVRRSGSVSDDVCGCVARFGHVLAGRKLGLSVDGPW